MSINIKKLAELANTSASSVSLVLNDKWHKKVRPEVAKLVKQIAKKQGYVGNTLARGLVLKRHFRISLCVDDLLSERPVMGYFSSYDLISLISAKLNSRRYALEILPTSSLLGERSNTIGSISDNRDAVIFLLPSAQRMKKLLSSTMFAIPYMVVDTNLNDKRLCYICTDMIESAYNVVSHFLNGGHRRIGIIQGETWRERFIPKMKGYRRALSERRIRFDSSLVFNKQNLGVFERGYAAGSYFLSMKNVPTALFCTENTCAVGLLSFLREKGVKVPEEIEVISFGDKALAGLSIPALSYVERAVKEMAKICVEKILAWVEKEEEFKPCQILCKENIVFQGTTRILSGNE